MKAIDTNLLARFITGDDPDQARKVYNLFKKAATDNRTLFVPAVVIMELIWVLESRFSASRDEIIKTIGSILLMPVLQFEHQSAIQRFVRIAEMSNSDLSDLMIGLIASECGCKTVLTFDKKASKSEYFELVE